MKSFLKIAKRLALCSIIAGLAYFISYLIGFEEKLPGTIIAFFSTAINLAIIDFMEDLAEYRAKKFARLLNLE